MQPASRVILTLFGILSQAQASGVLVPPEDAPEPTGLLAEQLGTLTEYAPGVPLKVLGRTAIAWTQLFGMISFELFGQLVGSMDPADEFFADATGQLATFLGLS